MQSRYRLGFLLLFGALLAGGLAAAPPGNASVDDASATPGAMIDLADALTTAFAFSFDEEAFQDPANRPTVGEALRSLADASVLLGHHGAGLDPSTGYLRAALARDAEQAAGAYEAGRYESARLRLHQITENCFACHTRLPGAESAALGERLARGVDLDRLETRDRIRFMVATRRFQEALATSEAALRRVGEPPARIAALFEDFLKLSVRAGQSYEQARVTLQDFLKRPNVPRYLAARVEAWIDALRELEKVRFADDLRAARMLIETGQLRNEFPSDRRGLVHFVAASGVLFRFVETHSSDTAALAEAYYLLGITESHVSSSSWTEQTEFFLETAIRLEPRSPAARDAYAFLREYIIAKYSGSSGVFVPEAVWRDLDELRAIIEGTSAG